MATPFSDVYARFVPKLRDYDFINLQQTDLEEIFEGYLISAIVRFSNYCKNASDIDRTIKQFNIDLTLMEIEILSFYMCLEYLLPQVLRIENLKQTMSTNDYKKTSQAQHLKELKDLRKDIEAEANHLILLYSYGNGNLGDLK